MTNGTSTWTLQESAPEVPENLKTSDGTATSCLPATGSNLSCPLKPSSLLGSEQQADRHTEVHHDDDNRENVIMIQ